MVIVDTNYNFFATSKTLKLLNNLDCTSKLLPSKNEIHSHKRFERICLIEWEQVMKKFISKFKYPLVKLKKNV